MYRESNGLALGSFELSCLLAYHMNQSLSSQAAKPSDDTMSPASALEHSFISAPSTCRDETRHETLLGGLQSPLSGPFTGSTETLLPLFAPALDNAPIDVRIEVRADRGFFTAKGNWTCYRRNFFHITTAFELLHKDNPYTDTLSLLHNDAPANVHSFKLRIRAQELDTQQESPLIQNNSKRNKHASPIATACLPNGNIHDDSSPTTVAFTRLQFRQVSSRSNGSCDHVPLNILIVELMAVLANGEEVCVAQRQSEAIVVRARSACFYAERTKMQRTSATKGILLPKFIETEARERRWSDSNESLTSAASPSVSINSTASPSTAVSPLTVNNDDLLPIQSILPFQTNKKPNLPPTLALPFPFIDQCPSAHLFQEASLSPEMDLWGLGSSFI